MTDYQVVTGAYCGDCEKWTWVQGDETPTEFLEPDACGACGGSVDRVDEYALNLEADE